MKKLILLLALISSFAFGIDKKTPTGGTVKDKPGQSQSTVIPEPTMMTDAQATKLGLKQYLCDKSGGANDITYNNSSKATLACVTHSPTNLTVKGCLLMPYQVKDGSWRLKFNIVANFDVINSVQLITFDILGITFNSSSAFYQAMSGWVGGAGALVQQYVISNTNDLTIITGTTNASYFTASGDVSLNSKPVWAY